MYIHSGAKNRRSGTTMQKRMPRGRQKHWIASQEVLSGFPAEPFESIEAAEKHASGDTIPCLVCGRHYVAVLCHAVKAHDLDESQYRVRFNIPFRISLVGVESRERRRLQRERHLDRIEEGRIRRLESGEPFERPARVIRTAFGGDAARASAKLASIARVDALRRAEEDDDGSWHLGEVERSPTGPRPKPPAGRMSWDAYRRRVRSDERMSELHRKASGGSARPPKKARPPERIADGTWPRPRTPMSLDEIRAYFSQDEIPCLVCGVLKRSLGAHIRAQHGMTVDDYRAAYGLPWRRGLVGEASRNAYAEASGRNPEALRERIGRCRHLSKSGTRKPRQRFRDEISRENVGIANERRGVCSVAPEAFDEIMRRIARGRTPKEVCSDPDMPGTSWMRLAMKTDPEKARRYREAIEALPYPVQARMEALGTRFVAHVRRLRKGEGGVPLSDRKMAAMLGVTTMTVNRIRRKHAIA